MIDTKLLSVVLSVLKGRYSIMGHLMSWADVAELAKHMCQGLDRSGQRGPLVCINLEVNLNALD